MGISDFEFKARGLLEEKIVKYRNSIPRKAVIELVEKIIQTYNALYETEPDPADHFPEVTKTIRKPNTKKVCTGYWGIECADDRCPLEVENRAQHIAKNLPPIKSCIECPYNKGCDSCIEKDCPERRE